MEFRVGRKRLAAALTLVLTIGVAVGGNALPVSAAPPAAKSMVSKRHSTPVKTLASNYSAQKLKPSVHPAGAAWPATGAATTAGTAHIRFAARSAATNAGVDGVLLTVQPAKAGGPQHLRLSYASFKNAYGGDWSSRLRLVTMPACALTTPQLAACRTQTPLATTNDSTTQTLAANLSVSADTVVGATSDTGGGNGDFSATPLKTSGSWRAGGSADSFSWSYPIDVPAVPGDLTPKVSLSYDSQSQDGLTSSTNNQASVIGDGWDYSPGFIERSYRSCHENPAGSTKTWDNCWSDKNTLTLSLNGSNIPLVKDDDSKSYHPKDDNNEKVDYLTGADNGAQGGEYWRITTADGIQYYFGRNKMTGFTSTSTATNSVWTEPVFETDSSRSCYNATFAKSYCQQAYRWNLDYVVDTHKDTIAYFYKAQQNYYASALGTTGSLPYTRGGYLSSIQYGQRDGQTYSTTPAGKVTFNLYGRCDTSHTGCDPATLSSSTAKDWPDVPYDANCAKDATCHAQSPTFWNTMMLTGIQTEALAGTALAPVDSWALSHSFPDPQDLKSTAALWLDSITRTGQDTTAAGGPTTAITLPAVTFAGKMLSNRVNIANGYPPLTRQRLDTITTETGEKISVGYSTAICPTCAPADPKTNTTLSYPAYWTPTGKGAPMMDWFNKYVVTAVTEQDTTDASSNDDITTTYTPLGKPAWHYDTNPLTPTDERTWNEFRGFAGMTVSTGGAPDPITKTVYSYFRGMDADPLRDSRADPGIADLNQYAGATYETQVFNGSALVTDTITDPWSSAATATQKALGYTAYHLGSARTRVYTPLASGGERASETDTTHDALGRVTAVSDLGDTSTPADDLCTTTSYADNTKTAWILGAVDETKTVSVVCGKTPSLPADMVSDQLTYYDSLPTLGAPPNAADTTEVQNLKSYDGTTPHYTTVTTVPDQYGRPKSVTDGESRSTATTYTPAAGAEPTSVEVDDPLKLGGTTTTYDQLRDLALTVTTPAGYVTTSRYDALGRNTQVFKPGRPTNGPPSIKFQYSVSNTGPSLVNTYTLIHDGSGYQQSETLYDSMLRVRETQTQAAGSGRIQSDTFYNSDGWRSGVADAYYNAAGIGTLIQPAQDGTIDSETGYQYDGAGRKIADLAYSLGDEKWRTSYAYGGDFVTTTPPTGGTASTTVTDARGNQVLERRYHAGITPDYLHAAAGTYDDTSFTFTPNGKVKTETDAAGNGWSWTYDVLGETTSTTDPDTGKLSTTYDDDGAAVTVTNAEGRQTTTKYDADSRRTGLYDTTGGANTQLSGWTYDTIKKGLPTASVSYSGGDTYTRSAVSYNLYGLAAAEKVTLTGPDAAMLPAAGYTTTLQYEANGLPDGTNMPGIGDLPQESTGYTYDEVDQPIALTGKTNYVSAVGYTELAQPTQYTLDAGTTEGFENLTYDQQTRALSTVKASGFGHTTDIDNVTYTYGGGGVSKGSGLLTKIVDQQDGNTTTDTQCFAYDYAQRLAQAWTATNDCATTPAAGNSAGVGGAVAPYWQSWTYTTGGDRQTQTDHDVAGVAANDTTTTYNYPAAGSTTNQPNTLSNTTATGPHAATQTGSYAYDKTGETTGISGGTHGNETLTWTATGRVATDTTAAGTTTFVYDADGNQIVQRDPATTTLYLGDQQIVMNNSTKTLTGDRYYQVNGNTVAVRSGTSVVYLVIDRQNTSSVSINAATGAVTRRHYTPFGTARSGAAGPWIGNKGYVGGTDDSTTGLETLGARQYDAATGRFISADPVLQRDDANQRGGYDYAGNNPVVHSDPSGLMIDGGSDGGGSSDTGCQSDNACNPEPGGSAASGDDGSGGGGGGHHGGSNWYKVLNKGTLDMPPKDMDPGQVIDLGKARYQQFLVQLQEWLRAKKGRLRGATLIVAQVNVATFVNGSVINVPRTIAFLNAGKSVDKQWLKFFSQENIGVPLLQATPGAGTKEKGHAEAAAAGLRQDQEGQQELLGGQMQDVPTVISGTKLCSVECSDDLNVFLNHKNETGQGDWGVRDGHAVSNAMYLSIRRGYGSDPALPAGQRVPAMDFLLRNFIFEGQIPKGEEDVHSGIAGAITAGSDDDE